MNYQQIIFIMKRDGIIFSDGITDEELAKIENIYNIDFPLEYKNFIQEALPISQGFYNWKDFSEQNVINISRFINKPKKILKENLEFIEWSHKWGTEPLNQQQKYDFLTERINNSPTLIPIYLHRYIPIVNNNPPVLSIYETDVIYYGQNLLDYLQVEFCNKQLDGQLKYYEYIPFWSDLME
ncbi:MAG: hypothetical protein J6M05_02900 [Cardiobacteriaceae bacterium]|nr:hypothetical protein [Cardiobacteriaceae bacterium]